MFRKPGLMLRISLQRFAQHDNYLNPIHEPALHPTFKTNHEQSTTNRQSGKSAAS